MTVLLLFSSPHSFSVGFRSEDWDRHGKRLILCSVNHFCVYLGLLSWWKIQTRPIIRFLSEEDGFDFLSVGIWWKNHAYDQLVQLCLWKNISNPAPRKKRCITFRHIHNSVKRFWLLMLITCFNVGNNFTTTNASKFPCSLTQIIHGFNTNKTKNCGCCRPESTTAREAIMIG